MRGPRPSSHGTSLLTDCRGHPGWRLPHRGVCVMNTFVIYAPGTPSPPLCLRGHSRVLGQGWDSHLLPPWGPGVPSRLLQSPSRPLRSAPRSQVGLRAAVCRGNVACTSADFGRSPARLRPTDAAPGKPSSGHTLLRRRRALDRRLLPRRRPVRPTRVWGKRGLRTPRPAASCSRTRAGRFSSQRL